MSVPAPQLKINGKVALVTGAARGIGRAIALRLARDGYHVAINDIPQNQEGIDEVVKEIEALGRRAVGVPADVSDADQTQAMVAKVVEVLGRLDTSVANAGIAEVKSILETTVADRRRMLSVNCEGLMNTYISSAQQMIKQGDGGRILGACSIAAYNPGTLMASYSASKFFVKGYTQVAAKEFAKHGIRVNAFAPGIVDTPMWDHIDAEMAKELGLEPGEARQAHVDRIALKRLSVPEDVAKLVSFLASEDAEYITGQCMITDGGCSFA
ncbi:NAD(P)-binding protein [Leucosporidium creatinivorum]|uniref:NAD(P)-binding protein n=1 Tax=Leucosporidium creatinivorum TaxID=106004 RepID=A0A1Y2FQD2_9BASI|nr:NAD(P)-binding protein [Leucosporidium creatinivorum]